MKQRIILAVEGQPEAAYTFIRWTGDNLDAIHACVWDDVNFETSVGDQFLFANGYAGCWTVVKLGEWLKIRPDGKEMYQVDGALIADGMERIDLLTGNRWTRAMIVGPVANLLA